MALRPLTGRVDPNAKTLVLRCATGDGSTCTVEPDDGENSGLLIELRDRTVDEPNYFFVDPDAARELFNYLGVWLHTR